MKTLIYTMMLAMLVSCSESKPKYAEKPAVKFEVNALRAGTKWEESFTRESNVNLMKSSMNFTEYKVYSSNGTTWWVWVNTSDNTIFKIERSF